MVVVGVADGRRMMFLLMTIHGELTSYSVVSRADGRFL